MARALALSLLVPFVLGCGPKPASGPAATAGGGGEPAPTCEPGRCLGRHRKSWRPRRADARACYDAGRKRDRTLEGRIIVNFEIDPAGAVADASQGMQDNQITDAEVVECVLAVVRTLTFAPSSKGKRTRAYHHFEFNPR